MSSTRYRSKTDANGAHLAAMLLTIPLLTIFHGWALKTAWNWFVPAVTAWPRLGIAQAIGISVVLAVARPRTSRSDTDEKPAVFWLWVVTSVFTVLLTLGIGWVVHEVVA